MDEEPGIARLAPERAADNDLSRRIYRVLLRWIPFADAQFGVWDVRPGCGHFFGGNYWYGMETAECAFVYAVLSRLGEYDGAVTRIPREEMARKAVMAVRYLGFTHDTGPEECVRPKGPIPQCSLTKWGGRNDGFFMASQVGRPTAMFGIAGWLLWPDLDGETRSLVRNVVVSYAERWSAERPRNGVYYDTQIEENGWTAHGIAAALSLFPDHPHHAAWEEAFVRWALNSCSAPKDRFDEETYLGRSLRWDWLSAETVHPDFTAENHGFVHPGYLCGGINLRAVHVLFSLMAGRPWLECAVRRNSDVYGRAVKVWAQHDGLAVPLQGQDWWYNRHHERLETHVVMNVVHRDPDAALLERRALDIVERLQGSNVRGCLLEENGEECVIRAGHQSVKDMEHQEAGNLALSYLLHAFGGPGAEPAAAEDLENRVDGVHCYPYGSSVVHRRKDSFSSFSWRSNVMALCLPAKGMWTVTAPFSSLVGEVKFRGERKPKGLTNEDQVREVESHRVDTREDGFAAVAVVRRGEMDLLQHVAFLSLPDGRCVYRERFECRKSCEVQRMATGLVGIRNEGYRAMPELAKGRRTVYTPDAEDVFEGFYGREPDRIKEYPPAPYLNVDGEIGYVLRGSQGIRYVNRHQYTHWKGVEDLLYLNQGGAAGFREGEALPPFLLIALPNRSVEQTRAAHERSFLLDGIGTETGFLLETEGWLAWAMYGPKDGVLRGSRPPGGTQVDLFDGVTEIRAGVLARAVRAAGFSAGFGRRRCSVAWDGREEPEVDFHAGAAGIVVLNRSARAFRFRLLGEDGVPRDARAVPPGGHAVLDA